MRPFVCLSVVCNARMHATQPVEIFRNVSTLFGTLTSAENFTEIVPGEPPPSGVLNARGVAKYTVSQKTVQNCFCHSFFKFPPILIFLAERWQRS